MKKILLSSLAIAAICVSVNAQSFSLGVKAGAIGTKIDGNSFDKGYQLSYQAGAFAEVDLLGTIGIQPELLLSQTNTTYSTATTVGGVASSFSTDIKLSYLSIPVLLRYNVAKILTFNLGPQYSILLNKGKSGVDNVNDAFKSGDFAIVAGAQVHVSSLRVYARYVVGLSDQNDAKVAYNTDKWKSQQIQVGVGIKLL
ncbi:porin family protein [Parasediminibacterium sp. JCM 36343]|uniref:porin family protein n=1 Tax=Parasediminibacterium sp. JCM 36343 TaxID=3374279 RepID=UPI0039790013